MLTGANYAPLAPQNQFGGMPGMNFPPPPMGYQPQQSYAQQPPPPMGFR